MIEMDYVNFGEYTSSIVGNSGENELVICLSPSQAGSTPLVVIHCSVDGGMDIVENLSAPGTWVKNDALGQHLYRMVMEWVAWGIELTIEQLGPARERAIVLVNSILRHHGYDKFLTLASVTQ